MAVTIRRAPAKPTGNRRIGYDRKVRAWAPDLATLQAEGCISAAQIADALRSRGILTSKGKPLAESTIWGMLVRGKALGLPFTVRTRSEAAAARLNHPRELLPVRWTRG